MHSMGSIDGFKYPARTSEEVVEIADVLVNQHGGEVSSEQKFANDLGHSSSNSGTYMQKIADARKFQVLESRGIKATDLARDLANPMDQEHERDAMFRMFQNIPLLKRLYEHLKGDEAPEPFWRILTELTDASAKDAKDASDEVLSLYNEMISYSPEEDTKETSGDTGDDSEVVSESNQSEPIKPSSGGVYVQVGDNTLSLGDVSVMNLQLAQTMLSHMEQKLKQQNSQEVANDGAQEQDNEGHGKGLSAFSK